MAVTTTKVSEITTKALVITVKVPVITNKVLMINSTVPVITVKVPVITNKVLMINSKVPVITAKEFIELLLVNSPIIFYNSRKKHSVIIYVTKQCWLDLFGSKLCTINSTVIYLQYERLLHSDKHSSGSALLSNTLSLLSV